MPLPRLPRRRPDHCHQRHRGHSPPSHPAVARFAPTV